MSYIGVPPFGQTVRTLTELTASAAQAVFNISGGYLPGYIDVFLNGSLLASSDFTATNGTTVTLLSAAAVGDEFKAIAYWPVSLVDTYRKAEADALMAGKQNSLGYTPVNKAGDTITGDLNLAQSAASNLVRPLLIKNNAPFGNAGQGVQLSMGNDIGSSHASPSGFIKTFTNNGPSGASVMIIGGFNGSVQQENMFIEPSGQIRSPFQPVFSATDAANTFTPGSNPYVYGTPVINRGNHYNSANGRFTAPVPGVYFFWHTASARTVSSGTYEVKIYLNGSTELARSFSNGAGYGHSAYASAYVQLNAGDFVSAGFYNGPGVVFSGQADVGNTLGICSGWGGYFVG